MTERSAPRKIGFIGLGRMGLPMAANLVRAGFDVIGYDADDSARTSFEQRGGRVSREADRIAETSDVLITMLPNGRIVTAALLEDPAFGLKLRAGSIVMDMSSSSPTQTTALAQTLASRGLTVIDAPVSGGVAKASDGSLSIFVGGALEVVNSVRPVLEAMGASIIPTGPIGSAHCMKALNNFVSAAGLVAVSEALHVGTKFGLAPATIVEALNASTGRNNTTERKAMPFMVPGNYTSGFAMHLMAKDVAIAADLAGELGMEMAELRLMAEIWREASSSLGPDADHTAMHQFIGRGEP